MKSLFKYWKNDLPSSLVVFIVALPLCLGIGLASTNVEGITGMPNLFSGIIAGVIGGIVVGALSGSRLGVSGPAAGLILIVISAIQTLGSFPAFLVAVVLSGIIQLIAGYLKAGIIGNYFPTSVIKGMLAAIGLTLILKELPHLVGYDADFFGDDAFLQTDGHNTFSELLYALEAFHVGAIIIGLISLGILILFEASFMKKFALFRIVPGALFAVTIGILLNLALPNIDSSLEVTSPHLVSLPVLNSMSEVGTLIVQPDWSYLTNVNVYIIAFTLALVASLETLLSVEATDRLDPDKHKTPTNQELKAQGVGNIVAGLLGGLPITQVIVRSSANINTGAKSKLSAIVHGILLISFVLFAPNLLNMIPLATLAAILLMVGYKLAKIKLFKEMYKLGYEQFVPFIGTILGVLFTDLLKGIGIGMILSIYFILKRSYWNNFKSETDKENSTLRIDLSHHVSFLNKGGISQILNEAEPNTKVIIDASNCTVIDYDVLQCIREFKNFTAKDKQIEVLTIKFPERDDK